ncbi:hypothetical protein D3C71_1909520 [compost metagenome]
MKQRSPKDLLFRLLCPLFGAGFVLYLITLLDIDSLMLGGSWLAVGLVFYYLRGAKSLKMSGAEAEGAA